MALMLLLLLTVQSVQANLIYTRAVKTYCFHITITRFYRLKVTPTLNNGLVCLCFCVPVFVSARLYVCVCEFVSVRDLILVSRRSEV